MTYWDDHDSSVGHVGQDFMRGSLQVWDDDRREWWNDTHDGGLIIVHQDGPGAPVHVEHLPPTYQAAPHLIVDGVAAAALHADIDVLGPDSTYAPLSNLTVTRPGARITHMSIDEPDRRVFDLLMYGRSQAAHQLLQRLNMRWKYRISPGMPEPARRALGGDPERHATPVIVEVDGQKIEALAEQRSGTVTLYPAHPKGTRTP